MLTLATFNVKDLFDPAFEPKLAELASQCHRADADVLAFQEVASQEALFRILSRMPNGAAYTSRVVALPDQRGIRNAIVSRIPFVASEVHMAAELPFPVFNQGDAQPFPKRIALRRGIPHVTLDVSGLGLVEIFTAHWKSKLPADQMRPDGKRQEPTTELERVEGDVRSLVLRAAEALYVRGLVDAALLRTTHVALMGDLNDTFDSVPLQIVRGRTQGVLRPCADVVPKEGRFSILHDGKKEQIDHILVSEALRERLEAASFQNEALRDHGPFIPGTSATPDSDHALHVARFHTNRLSRDSIVHTQRSAQNS